MRKKMPFMVVSFSTTEDAMGMESKAGVHGIPGRIISLPPEVDASCGMAWAVPLDDAEDLADKLSQAGIHYDKITLVELYTRV